MMNNSKALHPTQGEKGKDDLLPSQPCGEGPSDYSVPEAANTAALAALLARVEKAEGADREIDCLIAEWLNPDRLTPDMRGSYYGEFTGEYFCDGNVVFRADKLTASLDAALALVERVLPEAERIDIQWFPRLRSANSEVWTDENGFLKATRMTPALALLAAMLKALVAKGSEQ